MVAVPRCRYKMRQKDAGTLFSLPARGGLGRVRGLRGGGGGDRDRE